ncbi:hypothetical protein WICMUC_000467 [Wickerhamomyces mucosus]|uniref:Glycoside hydrolase family 17 protein n=1 Tax=Wickerhamomyces mucosus TaxID=1378264 RepID=A0A9P8PZ26_9ASCO|nr:hypothetical protein WICMUC_000467 [Wickerhamomyces mucosus]
MWNSPENKVTTIAPFSSLLITTKTLQPASSSVTVIHLPSSSPSTKDQGLNHTKSKKISILAQNRTGDFDGIENHEFGDFVPEITDLVESPQSQDCSCIVPENQTKIRNGFNQTDFYSGEKLRALREIGIQNVIAGAKGISYSFYNNDGTCKSSEVVQEDLAKISSFEIIRTYDTDCDSVALALRFMKPHQKLFAGIFFLGRLDESLEIISDAVAQYADGNWDRIDTISIGNEIINFGKAKLIDVRSALDRARFFLAARGYTGKIVNTDTLVAMLNNRELCTMSDYIAVNSHPYWDGGVQPHEAGPWLISQLKMLDDVCQNFGKKPIILAEAGWPKEGKRFGEHGIPSKDNQLIAIKSIIDALGPRTILFTAFNDYWKPPGSHGVEPYWGLLD